MECHRLIPCCGVVTTSVTSVQWLNPDWWLTFTLNSTVPSMQFVSTESVTIHFWRPHSFMSLLSILNWNGSLKDTTRVLFYFTLLFHLDTEAGWDTSFLVPPYVTAFGCSFSTESSEDERRCIFCELFGVLIGYRWVVNHLQCCDNQKIYSTGTKDMPFDESCGS